jgi:predicted DNA repair protein MutK
MPSGLIALLDDVAGIAKIAATSLDDVAAAAGKAGTKAAGVVIDDAAVTPRYVLGLTPDRELPIIWKIAKGSLRNKLLFLLPAALALSAFAPWLLPPLLMLGGAFLCFEAAEKLLEAIQGGHDVAEDAIATLSSKEIEDQKVGGAIRTDFILSGEIMAIALGTVATEPLWEQALILAVVALLITAGVYGVVGFIVKMDDIGLHLAKGGSTLLRGIGRGLVHAMPVLMRILSVVGTAAMLWVGGGLIVHGLHEFHFDTIPGAIHHVAERAAAALPAIGPVIDWLVNAIGAGIVGLVIGGIVVAVLHVIPTKKKH